MPNAPAAPATLRTLAEYLETGFWRDVGSDTHYYDIAALGGAIRYNFSGHDFDGDGISAERQAMALEAMKIFEAVLGIDFVETTATDIDGVELFFQDNEGGAFCSSATFGDGTTAYSIVNVEPGWNGGESDPNKYTFQTYLHEIGHALGLGHQGDYNLVAGYDTDAMWQNDSWQQSMMSYFSQTENTDINADFAHLVGPMAVDWLALTDLYAAQGYGVQHAFTGDTVWGNNTTITADQSASYAALGTMAATNAFCIVDGGGLDTVDFSGFSADQTINLGFASASSTTGSISSVGGLEGNMTLAVGTRLENAVGGSGNDMIIGNTLANFFMGGNGQDTLRCGAGADRLAGGAGDDLLIGGRHADTLVGGLGADVLNGAQGRDTFLFRFAGESLFGGATDTVTRFDGAGAASGDMFDFTQMGNLNWGGTDIGSIYLRNVGAVTHCYVNMDQDADPELDIAILDGARKAKAYTVDDFDFV